MQQGLSLRDPIISSSAASRKRLLAEYSCPLCQKAFGQVQWGDTLQLDDIIYLEVVKTCICGFEFQVYVVLNDELGVDVSAADALANSAQMPREADFQESAAALLLAHARGDLPEALIITAEAAQKLPDHAGAWYNFGWICGETNDYTAAIGAYDRVNQLAPRFVNAWFNKAVMCARLGLHDLAQTCMEQVQLLQPDLDIAALDPVESLEEREGKFGTISVIQSQKARRMLIDKQVQSGVFLEPGARSFYPEAGPGPGPVAETFNTNALLLAGVAEPKSMLFLGLGSGAGAVSLLHHYDDLHIDVVEIDPVVIDITRRQFPLVAYFEAQGRLTIIQDDAFAFVAQNQKRYDAVFLDLFGGQDEQTPGAESTAFLKQVIGQTDALWVNLIGTEDSPYLAQFQQACIDAGAPLQFWASALSPSFRTRIKSNWLGSTAKVDLPKARTFEPFSDRLEPHDSLVMARGHYREILRWVVIGGDQDSDDDQA